MIRVLHVVGNMDFGGVETFLMRLYRNMDRELVQFDFVCHGDTEGKYDGEIGVLGGSIVRVKSIRQSSLYRYENDLRHIFEDAGYSIVHAHLNKMNGIVLHQALRARIPVRISHSHSHGARYSISRSMLRKYAQIFLARSSTHGFACSKDAAEFVHRGRMLDNTRILNNAIDIDHFTPSPERRKAIRESLGLSERFVIGHVGRFELQKNHKFLIEVLDQLHWSGSDATLLLVGVGSLETQVRAEVEARGLGKAVVFLGPRSDVRDLMDAMDVFVFPSLFEGLGIVAVEAQAMGLPVLASEAVPRETKLTDLIRYLPLGDPAPWVDAITAVSSDSRDRPRGGYGDLVAAGGYDIRQVARELQDFYVSAVAALPTNGRAL